jgi:hypothetical protein
MLGMTFMLLGHVLAAGTAVGLRMLAHLGHVLRRRVLGRRLDGRSSGGERRSHQNQHDILLKIEG